MLKFHLNPYIITATACRTMSAMARMAIGVCHLLTTRSRLAQNDGYERFQLEDEKDSRDAIPLAMWTK